MTIAAATIMGLPLGSIYAFSVFLAPLEQLLRVSRSELATVFGISIVFFTIGANLVPRLFGYVRAPLLVVLTSALSAAGVILAAVAPSLSWLILGYGLLFATGGGMAFIVLQQCVNAAPLTKPGLVNGYLVGLFLSVPCWPHRPLAWGSIGLECVKHLPALRLWSARRELSPRYL